MPFLCASFCQGLCFRRSEARVAQPARAHHHTRVRVDIPNNVVRDIEYGQNSMSEIKTLAQKMDIGRYGKLGTLGSQNFRRLRRAKSGFHYREFFAIHIRSATQRRVGGRHPRGGRAGIALCESTARTRARRRQAHCAAETLSEASDAPSNVVELAAQPAPGEASSSATEGEAAVGNNSTRRSTLARPPSSRMTQSSSSR